LSKPINGEELLAELEELSAKIEEKRRATQIRERYLKEMEENTLRERKKLFQSLVVGDNTAAELLESAERLGIDLSAPWYNIILFKTQSLRHAQDEYSGSLIRIEEELRSLEDGTTVVSFDRNLEGKAFLLKAESEEQLQLQQQEYIEKIKGGWTDIDVIITMPSIMGKIGALGRVLGPRGLMPNPKSGTVTMDVAKAVKEVKQGKIDFKVDKSGIVHTSIGKVSFEVDKIRDNAKEFIATLNKLKPTAAKGTYIKSIYLSSTMSAGIKIDPKSIEEI
jgi:hypothetical protein